MPRKAKPTEYIPTPDEALMLARSAVGYCVAAGMQVQVECHKSSIVIVLGNATIERIGDSAGEWVSMVNATKAGAQ